MRARSPMPSAEQRAAVLATARAMAAAGLVEGSQGNVSARLAGGALITPRDIPYGEMQPADMVELELEGTVVVGAREPSSE